MLKRLAEAHPSSISALTHQYRMNEEICKLSSYMIYGGRLKCGSDEVRNQRLSLPGFPTNLPPVAKKGVWPWLKMAISPDCPVTFVDTDNIKKSPSSETKDKTQMEALEEKTGGRVGGRITNPVEAKLVRYIIDGLVATGASLDQIGVISPFRVQVCSKCR